MIKNFLKVALRSFRRQKVYTLINTFGLAIGIACFILIYFFIKEEFTYDTFYEKSDRIFMTLMTVSREGNFYGRTPFAMAPALKDEIPEVENSGRFSVADDARLKFDGEISTCRINFADRGFFEIFDTKFIFGNARDALSEPNNLIITERIKEQYFRGMEPIGNELTLKLTTSRQFQNYRIAGVVENPPVNSTIQFDFIMPIEHADNLYQTRSPVSPWSDFQVNSFVMAGEKTNISSLKRKIEQVSVEHNIGSDWQGDRFKQRTDIIKIGDLHFNREIRNVQLEPPSNPMYSYILGGIALLVLIIAGVNFMNLTIGLSTKRAKEVGMRKVFGAHRKQVVQQFLFESVLLSAAALMIGLMMAELFLPVFNNLSGKNLEFDYYKNIVTLLSFSSFILVLGVFSGSYPSLILSGFNPVKVLKGTMKVRGSNWLAKGLIIMQYSLAIFLITCSLIMSNQLDYVITKDLGYSDDLIMVNEFSGRMSAQELASYKNELLKMNGVVGAAGINSNIFGDDRWGYIQLSHEGEERRIPTFRIDDDFLDMMNIKIVQGRNFDRNRPSDNSNSVIVNEAFMKELGITDFQSAKAPMAQERINDPAIIGVVKDFHFESLRSDLKPVILHRGYFDFWSFNSVYIKLNSSDISGTINEIKDLWTVINPDEVFKYSFLDENLAQQYISEDNWKRIIHYATGFAILIAALGLFGMTSLSVARRTKEMGIRKVLGASMYGIVTQFNKEYFLLVSAALVLAVPTSYYIMAGWLESFAYTLELGAGIFLLSAIPVFVLTAVIISVQGIKTAATNPIDTLRYE